MSYAGNFSCIKGASSAIIRSRLRFEVAGSWGGKKIGYGAFLLGSLGAFHIDEATHSGPGDRQLSGFVLALRRPWTVDPIIPRPSDLSASPFLPRTRTISSQPVIVVRGRPADRVALLTVPGSESTIRISTQWIS